MSRFTCATSSISPEHVYRRPGLYNVTLQVGDRDGATDSDSTNVFIVGDADNQRPNCSLAVPSIRTIFPPTRRLVPVEIQRVIDPDGDPVSITIDGIFQDEPVFFLPDGRGVGTDTARSSGRWSRFRLHCSVRSLPAGSTGA